MYDIRLVRHLYPRNRHKQFPRRHCDRSLLFPLRSSFLQLVLNLKTGVTEFWRLSSVLGIIIYFTASLSPSWLKIEFSRLQNRRSLRILDIHNTKNTRVPGF